MRNYLLILCVALMPVMAEELSYEDYRQVQNLKIEAGEKEADENYKAAAKCYHKAAKLLQAPAEKAEMLLREAECLFEGNYTHRAKEAYVALMKEYALYIPYEIVVGRLRTLAERYVDGNGTFWGIRDRSAAIDVYFLILTEAPSIQVSLADRRRLAELLHYVGRNEEAVVVYQDILKMDPTLDDVRLDFALLLVELCKEGDGDGSLRRGASRQAQMILERNPSYPRKAEIELIINTAREVEAQRLLELGRFYLRQTSLKPAAARHYLQELLQKYPGSKSAWEGQELLETHPAFKAETSQPQE